VVETNALDAERTKTIEGWFGLFGALGFFGAICLLGYQAFLWLKEGQWTPIPISSVLGKLNIDYYSLVDISWAGAQKIVVWLLDLPLSLGIVVFGGLVGVLVGYLINEISLLRK
jgi:hypothetical protein